MPDSFILMRNSIILTHHANVYTCKKYELTPMLNKPLRNRIINPPTLNKPLRNRIINPRNKN